MADISVKKGTDLTWLWAIAAVIAVGALMAWLYVNRPADTGVVMTDAEDTTASVETAAATAVELEAVGAAPADYVGQQIQVADVPVTVLLGPKAFWADVPGQSPLFVAVDSSVEDASWVTEGATLSVEGSVQPITPEALDAMVQSQALLPEGRMQAEIATHYLNVTGLSE